MRKLILFMMALMLFAGCLGKPAGKTEITTGEGKMTVTEGVAGPDWCKAGTTMSLAAPTTGEVATWTIKGITTYKGRQVCAMEIKVTEKGQEGIMTYYFTEDSSYVAMVSRDPSGKETQVYELAIPQG